MYSYVSLYLIYESQCDHPQLQQLEFRSFRPLTIFSGECPESIKVFPFQRLFINSSLGVITRHGLLVICMILNQKRYMFNLVSFGRPFPLRPNLIPVLEKWDAATPRILTNLTNSKQVTGMLNSFRCTVAPRVYHAHLGEINSFQQQQHQSMER